MMARGEIAIGIPATELPLRSVRWSLRHALAAVASDTWRTNVSLLSGALGTNSFPPLTISRLRTPRRLQQQRRVGQTWLRNLQRFLRVVLPTRMAGLQQLSLLHHVDARPCSRIG